MVQLHSALVVPFNKIRESSIATFYSKTGRSSFWVVLSIVVRVLNSLSFSVTLLLLLRGFSFSVAGYASVCYCYCVRFVDLHSN